MKRVTLVSENIGVRCVLASCIALLLTLAPMAHGQLSLSTVVDFALRSDPKVKMAQADLDKAKAALAEVHDAYVPSISTSFGYGASTGVPLSLPVIFSVSAQSLVFNFSQKDYIRAAGSGVVAANYALEEARSTCAEDAVTTYVSLDNALRRRAMLSESASFAARLVNITQDRFSSGLDPHIELTRSQRTTAQLRLQQLLLEDEVGTLTDHLSRLTGLRNARFETVRDSIPPFVRVRDLATPTVDSPGIKASFATADARTHSAIGDSRYRLRPQLGFSAGYSRITTVGTNYIQYYPGFDPARHPDISYNSLDVGVQVTIPILDLVHQAKARGSAAEAARARFEAEDQRNQFTEGRKKLEHAASELDARAELAILDRSLAQDQLEAIEVQLQAGAGVAGGPQLTPKDEQNARLQERQRSFEMLTAELQLRQAEISLMRQNGSLGTWVHETMPAANLIPPAIVPDTAPATGLARP